MPALLGWQHTVIMYKLELCLQQINSHRGVRTSLTPCAKPGLKEVAGSSKWLLAAPSPQCRCCGLVTRKDFAALREFLGCLGLQDTGIGKLGWQCDQWWDTNPGAAGPQRAAASAPLPQELSQLTPILSKIFQLMFMAEEKFLL